MNKIVRPGGSITLPQHPYAEGIYEAMLCMDWNDASQWTKGKPKVSAIEKLLKASRGRKTDIKEKDRDEFWDVFVKKIEELADRANSGSGIRVRQSPGGAK
tara:strand:+ start:9613 stop:9915 length:303 start_codon:yes stop_codon:yes gene_type:complete